MQLYLATAPQHLAQALDHTAHIAHMAYRMGPDGQLHIQSLPAGVQGGLMLLGDTPESALSQPELLAGQILQVCLRRNFAGVVLDLQQSYSQLPAFARQLGTRLGRHGRRLYVPESCAGAGTVLICTAISGGTLAQRLSEAAARYGAGRIALDLQRLAMDFLLPAPQGEGTPLSLSRLRQLMTGRPVYFSNELGARYFTYVQGGRTHFVLFDDAATLIQKIRLAEDLGIRQGFVMLPETEDLLSQLPWEKKEAEP